MVCLGGRGLSASPDTAVELQAMEFGYTLESQFPVRPFILFLTQELIRSVAARDSSCKSLPKKPLLVFTWALYRDPIISYTGSYSTTALGLNTSPQVSANVQLTKQGSSIVSDDGPAMPS